jgi:outer membrane protein OmpA-like peptidoglycan-associated protein
MTRGGGDIVATFWKSVRTSLLLAGLLGGCAHSYPPPRELTDARAAYTRASTSPQVDPARLLLAKQALNGAELAYGSRPEEEVRDRAYVALRRLEAVEATAQAEAASQRHLQALRDLAALKGAFADRARAELASAEARASGAQARAVAAEGQASEAEQQAERERQAREAAETRANQAMSELSRMANVRREQRGLVITLSGQVLFASNEATLLPAAARSLDTVVSALKAMPPGSGRVVIEGHTDSRGARAYNRDLAERRARAVRDYLVEHGLPNDRFAVEGIGPDRPVADNRTPEGRANNRRVEIVLPPSAAAGTSVGTPGSAANPTATPPTEPLPGEAPVPAPNAPTPPTPVTAPPAGPAPTPPTGSPAPDSRYPSTPAYPPRP